MNNDMNDIYKKFGEKFCICPFLGGFYQSHGVLPKGQNERSSTITPCSVTYWENDQQFNVVNNNIKDSRNTEVWRNMRRAFAEGRSEELPQCKICHDTEQAGGHAPRLGANSHFANHCQQINLSDEIQKIIDNDYYSDKVATLDWFPSNYCNYSCVMCAGGASSTRMSYENDLKKHQQREHEIEMGKYKIDSAIQDLLRFHPNHIIHNDETNDFDQVINDVEVINFTGGETVMQKKVVDMIKRLADSDQAQYKTIFLLTNASTYPEDLMACFSKFRRVIYMCSVDGVGPVIEYQRRNAVWTTVEENTLRLLNHEFVSTILNFTLTSINVLGFMDFAHWVYRNNIHHGITISPVFRVEYLGMGSLPPELRTVALDRLNAGLEHYKNLSGGAASRCVEIITAVISVINSTPFNKDDLAQFVYHISNEDRISNRKFVDVVPEWQPYFNSSIPV